MEKKFESLNMDRKKTLLKNSEDHVWVPSPGGEVLRCQFERQYSESGWANSLVRYPKGATFHEHGHPGGEQFVVLEGIFSDHRGHFSEGTYVQNPIGYRHAPFSREGCLIFVRLGALQESSPMMAVPIDFQDDKKVLQTGENDWIEFSHLAKGGQFTATGSEIFILDGELATPEASFKKYSWLRIAKEDHLSLKALKDSKYLLRPLIS